MRKRSGWPGLKVQKNVPSYLDNARIEVYQVIYPDGTCRSYIGKK